MMMMMMAANIPWPLGMCLKVHYLIYVDITIIYILEKGRLEFYPARMRRTKNQAQMSRFQFLADYLHHQI